LCNSEQAALCRFCGAANVIAAFIDVTAGRPYIVLVRQQMRAVMLRGAFLTILVVIGLALSGVQPLLCSVQRRAALVLTLRK
jgi:hypothetical protein